MGEPKGTFYGIGVGPGDPELLTVKAVRILREVAAVFCPEARPGSGSHALRIVEKILDPKRQEIVSLHFPMKREPSVLQQAWGDAASRIDQVLSSGRDAAFITIGDPLLYSTFGYVLDALRSKDSEVTCKIIPAVTSITASAAAAQVPLARTGGRVLILPATYRLEEIREALEKNEAVVLIKVHRVIRELLELLREMGKADQAVLVSRCGTPEERVFRDLNSLDVEEVDYLSTLIVTRKEPGE